jgi:RNA polymerase-binding transcription factor DksA
MATAYLVDTSIPDQEVGAARVAGFRQSLVEQRSVQLDLALESDATAAEFGGQGSPGSIVGRELAGVSAARARRLIEEIDAALGRIDRGAFGRCEQCEVSIPVERLEAMPHARFCVRCSETGGGPLG